MNLSQSVQFNTVKKIAKNKSYVKLNNDELRRKQQYSTPEIIQVLIKLDKNDQLEPTFIDTFSSIIMDYESFDFYGCYGDVKVIAYSEFSQSLKNLCVQLKKTRKWRELSQRWSTLQSIEKGSFKKAKSSQNIRKGSVDIEPKPQNTKLYQFTFESHNNSIIILLDLSPYMLLYDYSTKSFVLQNLQEVVRDLFVGLEHHYKQRKNGDNGPSYIISCYAFSIHQHEVEQVMRQEQIFFADNHQSKCKNKDLIADYICAYINKSKLPHSRCHQEPKISVIQIIQKILNLQEGSSCMKTFITISSFKKFDTKPFVFYSSNWYTFCFICPGQLNFGSYLIDDKEIFNRIPKNSYFETKFVYKCKFLQNWQKVHLIEQQGFKFQYLDSSVQKSRAILYCCTKGDKKQSVFEDILKFKLKIGNRKIYNEGLKSNESVISAVKNPKLLKYQEPKFIVPIQNISQIMKTKYLQGWQQVSNVSSTYVAASKYTFKLEFANKEAIYYNALRKKDSLQIAIYIYTPTTNDDNMKQKKQIDQSVIIAKNQKQQICEKIKKIDLINTSSFDIVTAFKNQNITLNESKIKKTEMNQLGKFGKLNKMEMVQKNINRYEQQQAEKKQEMKIFTDIMDRHDEWSSYFRVKKIYIQFNPNQSYLNDLNQLLNQFGYLLGQRISHLCFMQRKQKKQKFYDTLKQREISRWSVIFVKVSGILHFLQFKFGFLKYSDLESKQTIQMIQNKLVSKKLINGSIKIIPQDIYQYCIQQFGSNSSLQKCVPSVFQRSWRIGFKNQELCKVFKYMNIKIIKKLGYIFIYSKLNFLYYYKIATFIQQDFKKEKCIFLRIIYENSNNTDFRLQVFPSFAIIQHILNKQSASQTSSQKNIYQYTTKSISSSNSQPSLTSTISLPIPQTLASQKDVSSNKSDNSQGKCKNFIQLFTLQIQQVRQSQRKLVNLIKCYSQIYEFLIKKRLEEKKSGIQDEQLIQKIKQLYRISGDSFEAEYLSMLQVTKKDHYSEEYQQHASSKNPGRRINLKGNNQPGGALINPILQINIDEIPEPKDYLMQSPITNLKGDLILISKTVPEKKYTFFLLTPGRIAYLWKKPNSQKIYFRCMSSIYSHSTFSQKQEVSLKQAFQKELKQRINKQLKQEHYLSFYNIISQQVPQSGTSPNLRSSVTTNKRKQSQNQPAKSIVMKSEQIISSFIGVSINCSDIYSILSKEENKYLEPRMIKILVQFRNKFFEYISVFFQKSKLQLKSSKTKTQEIPSRVASNELKISKDQGKKVEEHNTEKQITFESITKTKSQDKSEQIQKMNNYFFQKKNLNIQEQYLEQLSIKNIQDFNTFQNIILKVCANSNCSITYQNFVSLFINKEKKTQNNSEQQFIVNKNMQILIKCFSYKATKFSNKIIWLNGILQELLTQCIINLNLTTVTESNDIKIIESKLSDYISKGPAIKIPDQMWNQQEIVRQIQSGHMRTLIPFSQYSNKPFPAKFIARQVQNVPAYFTPMNKPNQFLNLKYWLTMQITPAKVLKTRLISFKHITLLTQIIVNLYKGNYQKQFNQMIDSYMEELIKFMKVRFIFKTIQHKLMFPLDPHIPIYINSKIYKKLEQQKKKLLKNKIPKKFKNRPTNLPSLELKSASTILSQQNNSFINIDSSANNSNSVNFEQLSNAKDMFRMPLIYQGTINYYSKFETDEILGKLAYCQKLNPNAIRNLQNTFIFFNIELKEYFIFYLEQFHSPISHFSYLNQEITPKTGLIRNNQKQNIRSTFLLETSQESVVQRTKSQIPSFMQNMHESFIEKKKNNALIYSVYCADKTIPVKEIEKLYGGLINKAIKEVTFYKIASHLYFNASVIDEAEEQYFKQGQKRVFQFKIPYIEQKNNLRQYFKQHLQTAFQHKKTQFRSQFRLREAIKKNQGEYQEQNKNRKNDTKISSKKAPKKQKKHESHCDQRCNPQMWIFNTTQNDKFQRIFGSCMFLMSIKMIDNVDSAQNALFWKRQVKQNIQNSYIYPFMSDKDSLQLNEDKKSYNEASLQKYLMRYNQRQINPKKAQSQSINDINATNSNSETILFQQIKSSTEDSTTKIEDQSLRTMSLPINIQAQIQKYNQITYRQPQKFTTVTIQILSYFGNPRFNIIYNVYQQLVYQSVYDYYFQNRFFRQLFANFNLTSKFKDNKKGRFLYQQRSTSKMNITDLADSAQQGLGNSQEILAEKKSACTEFGVVSLHRVQSSPISSSAINPSFQSVTFNNASFVNQIYQSLLDFFQTVQKKIPISKTQCVTVYKTQNRVLIEQKLPALQNFINKFYSVFLKSSKNIQKYAFRLVVYGMDKSTNSYYFWQDQFEKPCQQQKKDKSSIFECIQIDIIKQNLDFSKVGVFFCDSLLDLDSLRKTYLLKDQNKEKEQDMINRYWQTSNRTDNKVNIQFQWLKKYQEGKSFCQNQHLFRRSLALHHQISDSQFSFYSYNFKQDEVEQFLKLLEQEEMWFGEKLRLFNFISKIKKEDKSEQVYQYEIPPSTQKNFIKNVYMDDFKLLSKEPKTVLKKETIQHHQIQINLTKLLISLVFDQLPFKNFLRTRESIQKMYKILAKQTVPYNDYPQYKGKEKSKLVRIGREYLSILRNYYGFQKPTRKQSQIPSQSQKKSTRKYTEKSRTQNQT